MAESTEEQTVSKKENNLDHYDTNRIELGKRCKWKFFIL